MKIGTLPIATKKSIDSIYCLYLFLFCPMPGHENILIYPYLYNMSITVA